MKKYHKWDGEICDHTIFLIFFFFCYTALVGLCDNLMLIGDWFWWNGEKNLIKLFGPTNNIQLCLNHYLWWGHSGCHRRPTKIHHQIIPLYIQSLTTSRLHTQTIFQKYNVVLLFLWFLLLVEFCHAVQHITHVSSCRSPWFIDQFFKWNESNCIERDRSFVRLR